MLISNYHGDITIAEKNFIPQMCPHKGILRSFYLLKNIATFPIYFKYKYLITFLIALARQMPFGELIFSLQITER